MAPYRYDREVRDEEYVARVRRHTPETLLPLVAAAGASFVLPSTWLNSGFRKHTPWALADIARLSVVHGRSRHGKVAGDDDLLSCLCAYASLADPDLKRHSAPGAAAAFFLRLSAEQMAFQQPALNELARTVALFEQTTPSDQLTVLGRPEWAKTLFGHSLRDYVGTGFLLHVGAVKNQGTFQTGWLDQPNFDPITAEISAATMRDLIAKHFSADRDTFRAMNSVTPTADQQSRRFAFNPLLNRPVLAGFAADDLLIPVPHMLIRKISPLGVYYEGVARWGARFTEDLGRLFEAYVGRQLRLIEGAVVHPARKYGHEKRETVDWIVVMPEAVLAVEVKSVRPTEPVRLGGSDAMSEVKRMLARSREQLRTTVALVRERDPAVRDIPADRPLIGLTVTMEPFHVINSPLHAEWLPDAGVPAAVCGAVELEELVSVTDVSVGELLSRSMTDSSRTGWSISAMLQGHDRGRNSVLDAAFATYPWKSTAENAAA